MIALLQRVSSGAVIVDNCEIARIGHGVVVFLGVFSDDTPNDLKFLAEKVANLRIFEDSNGVMNYSLFEIGGEALCVSQFTLCANSRKGRRPSFSNAMEPQSAEVFYNNFCSELEGHGISIKKGLFGAKMRVEIFNEGPVSIILNSRESRRLNDRDSSPKGV